MLNDDLNKMRANNQNYCPSCERQRQMKTCSCCGKQYPSDQYALGYNTFQGLHNCQGGLK